MKQQIVSFSRSLRAFTVLGTWLLLMYGSDAQAQCTVSAGADKSYVVGGSLQLRATGADYYTWSPATGLSNANIANPVVSGGALNSKTTYTVTGKTLVGSNLIVNGNFEAGNTGFSSEYTFINTTPLPAGQYAVEANPKDIHLMFLDCNDRTTGPGKMFIANGAPTLDTKIWFQTITVEPNTDYAFSAYASTMGPESPPILQYSINGVKLGAPVTFSSNTCEWNKFYAVWNSGNNTTIEIAITNQNAAASGNDFAIDDISFFKLCSSTDQIDITVTSTNLCSVNAGSDFGYAVGQTGQLNATGADIYTWSPATGLSNPNIANPIVSGGALNSKTTYTVNSLTFLGSNLITNGDFEDGNTGFSSQYTYSSVSLIDAGLYAVEDDPSRIHPSFPNCDDQTSRTGKMLVVNGSSTLNTKIWFQTITVEPNTDYAFAAYATDMGLGSPPILQYSINGTLVGSPIEFTGITPCSWVQFYQIWNSGANTTIEIAITNQNAASSGNDFAIDEISFYKTCSATDQVGVSVIAANAPGSIANNLNLWLTGSNVVADNNGQVTQWKDRSGSGLVTTEAGAVASPYIVTNTNTVNFNPTVTFSGVSGKSLQGQSTTNFSSGAITIFAVSKASNPNNNNSNVFSPHNNIGLTTGFGPGLTYAGTSYFLDANGYVSAATTSSTNNHRIVRAEYADGSTHTGGFTYMNSTKEGTGSGGSTAAVTNYFEIGGRTANGHDPNMNRIFKGDISEVIVYKSVLTTDEANKVETYLAAKYGITKAGNYVSSDDKIQWDATANAAYHNRVTAIGHDVKAGLYQQIRSKSIEDGALVEIYHVTSDGLFGEANLNYCIIGDNNGDIAFKNTVNGDLLMSRTWLMKENSGIAANIQIKVPVSLGAKYILRDADGDFNAGATKVTMTLEGNYMIAEVPSIDQFFTFGIDKMVAPGNALEFDGVDDYAIGTSGLSSTNVMTVEAWIKTDKLTGFQNIVSLVDLTGDKSQFEFRLLDNMLEAGVNSETNVNWQAATSSPVLELGRWAHVAAVKNGADVTLYVNGVSVGTGTIPDNNTTPERINIGRRNLTAVGNDFFFDGQIDEVRLWDVALDLATIRSRMYVELAGNEANLVAYYNFNQGAGSVLLDNSTKGNNNSLNGMAGTEWTESYALVVPDPQVASNLTGSGFTANWITPVTGIAHGYYLDVATDNKFQNIVTGYDAKQVTGNNHAVTGLAPTTQYFYRVSAHKTSPTDLNEIGAFHYNSPIAVTTLISVPTVQASNVTVSNVTDKSFTVSWTRGDGENAVVYVLKGDTGSPVPTDNTTYTGNAAFGSGTQVGTSGWFAVYKGTGTTVGVTGLDPETKYRIMVLEFNGAAGAEKYLTTTATGNPADAETEAVAPTTQASMIMAHDIQSDQFTAHWTNGNGAKRVVFVKEVTEGQPEVTQKTTYNANETVGQGTQAGTSGWTAVYNGTGDSVVVKGITTGKTYRVMVLEYNGKAGGEKYNTTPATDNPVNVVIPNLEDPIVASNFISPDGDGKNDEWKVENVKLYKEFNLHIYNNLGELVYEGVEYDNSWRAEYNNRTLPKGTYYYVFIKDKIVHKGFITVVR